MKSLKTTAPRRRSFRGKTAFPDSDIEKLQKFQRRQRRNFNNKDKPKSHIEPGTRLLDVARRGVKIGSLRSAVRLISIEQHYADDPGIAMRGTGFFPAGCEYRVGDGR